MSEPARNYVNPKDLTQNQIQALQALKKHDRPAPIVDGTVHCGYAWFRYKIVAELSNLGLCYTVNGKTVSSVLLTDKGKAVAAKVVNWRTF